VLLRKKLGAITLGNSESAFSKVGAMKGIRPMKINKTAIYF